MVLLNKNSKKKVYQILREIKGLNKSNANYICKKLGFQKTCNLSNLENEDLEQLKNYLDRHFLLDKYLIESTNKQVKHKIDLGTYAGKRHNLGYPVRGQRTLSNGKTQRRLHKFRFYYESDLFSHVFFKNQRKSIKNRKIAKLVAEKKENKRKNSQYTQRIKPVRVFVSSQSQNNQLVKKDIEKKKYLKKLDKIKAERKKQVESRFQKEHKPNNINY
jgi:small subunit ribosomal protein S13